MSSMKDAIAQQLKRLQDADVAKIEAQKALVQRRVEDLEWAKALLVEAEVEGEFISSNRPHEDWEPEVSFEIQGVEMLLRVHPKWVHLGSDGSIISKFIRDLITPEKLRNAIAKFVAETVHKESK